MTRQQFNRLALALTAGAMLTLNGLAPLLSAQGQSQPLVFNPWMARGIVAQETSAKTDAEKEAVANRRAKLLLTAMTLPQKLQQLSGSSPEILPELPRCFGGRHVSGIAALNIPTFRITNGPVGIGQNDCIDRKAYEKEMAENPHASPVLIAFSHPSSAQATALPSAMGVAASFDPKVASAFGGVIATEMNHLALHVFEAPGVNLARLPILGRNFEYFGEDPYLTGTMAVAETKAAQEQGLIAMVKHYVANEQETNRKTIQETIDRQVLRELYLLPFEMTIKDGHVSSLMCAYNYVNGLSSCENREMLIDILRHDWGFTGYVQSDFFAMKSTVQTLKAGMDHEMPIPQFWEPDKITTALSRGELTVADIDKALERRYTQMFKAGIFDRPVVERPVDFALGGRKARSIGSQGAVLLQNNGVLPLGRDVRSIVLIGKASQVYAQQAVAGGSRVGKPMGAGGGSSDVTPHYTVTPIEGLRNALRSFGNATARVKLILVDDTNSSATIDGVQATFIEALAQAAAADGVVMMAGTVSEEGADRATFTASDGKVLASNAAAGSSLDWYVDTNTISTEKRNPAKNSNTVAMIKAVLRTRSATAIDMAHKSVLVLKDNASVAMDPALVGANGPAILEAWFPGQEDGNIVADLLFGLKNPSGKLPVTFPYAGKSFLDNITPAQFPGVPGEDGKTQTVSYSEQLHVGYRWYDANVSGQCAPVNGSNPCVAFPFGYGLSYTSFVLGKPTLSFDHNATVYRTSVTVTNTGKRVGAEVVQVYVSLPASADAVGLAQPPKRLVGFQKVEVAPGSSKRISITIDPAASHHPLSVWSERENRWVTPKGEFTMWLGTSSAPANLAEAGRFSL